MSNPTNLHAGDVAPPVGHEGDYFQQRFGALMPCPHLWMALGYPSHDAFRKAVSRGTVPIETFTIPNRRGRLAKTADVVRWLRSLSRQTETPSVEDSEATSQPT